MRRNIREMCVFCVFCFLTIMLLTLKENQSGQTCATEGDASVRPYDILCMPLHLEFGFACARRSCPRVYAIVFNHSSD